MAGTPGLVQIDGFAPTPEAAQARLAALRPADYARTRNHLDGAVTRLSPYLTHGFIGVGEVLRAARERGVTQIQHKLVQELAWRCFFHHRWRHLGEAIFDALHPGPLPEAAYAPTLPADLREARTGVPAIDQAVHTLHATGWLHNHARLWLASYVVHVRRVHWRAGADWLYGHLLDGDLASNHLSWQWVAGTGSHKPYLFNADNVARFAPSPWHSPGTVIDRSYEALERLARGEEPPPAGGTGPGSPEAATHAQPPGEAGFGTPEPGAVAGREVWLVHPWSLGAPPPGLAADAQVVAVALRGFHARWPWSARRWRFVGERLAALTPHRWFGDAASIAAALAGARRVHAWSDPHLDSAADGCARWPVRWHRRPAPWPEPAGDCRSFSQYWTRVSRGLNAVDDVLNAAVFDPPLP